MRVTAGSIGITELRADDRSGSLRFSEHAAIDPLKLVALIDEAPDRYRLDGPFRLRFTWTLDSPAERIAATVSLLLELGAVSVTAEAV